MSDYPKTCSECGCRRDAYDAGFRDWEEARRPVAERLAEAVALLRDVIPSIPGEFPLRGTSLVPDGWHERRDALVARHGTQTNTAPAEVAEAATQDPGDGGPNHE